MSAVGRETDLELLRRGRREGLAMAAVALSIVSFVNLLGAEKALLAIVLRGAGAPGRTDGNNAASRLAGDRLCRRLPHHRSNRTRAFP